MSSKEKAKGSLALATPRVITIPANVPGIGRKLRVAAYARVSSNSDNQTHSFAAQNAYFSKLIAGNPNWELADIYADKGITGTSIDKREDFLRMMEDCRKGRIDRILVKSISRFGRNTRESLEAVRELAGLGVIVLFEEQKIDTAESTGEMLTAIFATLAQKESESISEKMRWSYRMRMRSGTFLPSSMPYGYNIKDKQIRICPEEAETIKGIFSSYLAGQSMQAIANRLNLESIPRRVSSKTQCWRISTIEYILSNERYVGDSLWQKTYQTRELPHRAKKNKGELEQYFLPDTHLPIIDRETFMKAKQLRLSRKQCPARICEGDILRKRLRCGICGGPFRSIYGRNTHSYECQAKNRGSKKCTSLRTSETQLQQAFLRLYFKLKRHGESVLTQLITDLRTARNGSLLWSEGVVELNKQITDIAGQERLLLLLKQQGAVDPDLFLSRSDQLAEQRRTAKLKKERLLRSEEDHTIQRTQDLLDYLRSGPDTLSFFDEALFSELVEKIIVWATGDCHGNFERFRPEYFPEQAQMTKDDVVVVTGDFGGIWFGDARDDEALGCLESLPFTLAFVDGNHENYDALASYPAEKWQGGKIHRIRPHVLHLMRGQIYELEGYRFFTMGGAKSHDIEDGILDPDDPNFGRKFLMLQRRPRSRYRINHISWWAQELPSDEEYDQARRSLDAAGWQVDYIITHCAPTSIALAGTRHNEADRLTDFLQEVRERAKYHYWLFGHYHDNRAIDEKHILLWEQIVRVI